MHNLPSCILGLVIILYLHVTQREIWEAYIKDVHDSQLKEPNKGLKLRAFGVGILH